MSGKRASEAQAERAAGIMANLLGPGVLAVLPCRTAERGWVVSFGVTSLDAVPKSIIHPEEGHDVDLAWREVRVGERSLRLRCADLEFSHRFIGEVLAEPLEVTDA